MHKDLNADNIPIGWTKMYLGSDLMFQRLPITVLSARLNIRKLKSGERQVCCRRRAHVLSSAWIADMARSRIWLAASISLTSSSAEPSIGFSFFFNCKALRPWAFRSCSRSLMVSGSWLSSCWAWDKATSTCLSSANKASRFADRSEIFCFNAFHEDFKAPMFLCFSSVSVGYS